MNIETFPLFGLVELTYFHDYLERIDGVLVCFCRAGVTRSFTSKFNK